MRVLLYEWVTGGGLVAHHGALPASLLAEGQAMAQALAADLVAAGHRVTMLRDLRVRSLVAHGATVLDVASRGEHDDALLSEATSADAAIVIAPETDGALLAVVESLEAAGARLASPSSEFVALAGSKSATAERFAAAGVPVPFGRTLEPDERTPDDFPYPAVVKPIDGAGSQDTHVVARAEDRPPAYAWPRRIERYAPGTAASVAALCGAADGPTLLAPCRQRLSLDGSLRYLGGATPLAAGLADRAEELALKALAAMPPATGYVGIDVVLGPSPHGDDDVVIEVNPRLTTSYVGLRAAARSNLADAMLMAAAGQQVRVAFDPRPLAWDADGAVYYA
ncbi:MAG: ATP-grasp domain-containing protein [Lacipirellulaceae bacterium]